MGRVIKIILYIVLLFVVYLWISTVFKSCNNGSIDPLAELGNDVEDIIQEEENEDTSDEDLDLLDEEDEFFEDDADNNVDLTQLDAEEDTEDTDIYEPEVLPKKKPEQATTASSARVENVNVGGSGRYMVIAGSYLIRKNAENMTRKLKKMGYDPFIVIFDLSEYHTVVAGRYRDYGEAGNTKKQLSAKGIDSYVHVKK